MPGLSSLLGKCPYAVRSVAPAPAPVDAQPAQLAAKAGGEARLASSTRVVPLSRTLPREPLSFVDTFGRVGVLMVLVVLVSIVWTAWLIVVTVDPNGAANFVMDTAEFDDGMLWLIVNADLPLMVVNSVSLSLIALTYAWVGVRMTVLRNRPRSRTFSWRGPTSLREWQRCPGVRNALKFWTDMTEYSGPNRKLWNASNKAVDILVQFYALYTLMDAGISPSVCVAYAALVAVNSLSCAYFILTPHQHSIFTEVFIDAAFDMMFAVGMPIALLVIAALKFQFDRNRAKMYLLYFPAGWFEREIRLVSDAAEITAFRISFDGLRTKTWQDWCIRISMNFSFCYRLMRVVEVSIQAKRRFSTQRSLSLGNLKVQHRVPRPAGLLFVLASTFVMVYTVKSVTASQEKCEAFPQCVAFAHRWRNESNSCPCRAMIDVDRAPRTWEEWTDSPDVTEIVSALATSGDLKVLQIINRRLHLLPDELRRCAGLQQLVLMYTGIERFPDWAGGFPKLELIAIEGRPGERSLVYMPNDLFARMSSLMYFHLGAQPDLLRLPSFEGLTLLKTISFAMVSHLIEFPPVQPLVSLERVVMAGSHYMDVVPDFSENRKLVSLIIGDVGACCNGFFGDCRLPFICQSQSVGRCLAPSEYTAVRPTATAQAVFDRFNSSICEFDVPTNFYLVPILEENVRMCDGVLYRQCRRASASKYFPGELGMCYSDRMMVVACMYSPPHVDIRREEVARGIGAPCDPEEEEWLGCGVGA